MRGSLSITGDSCLPRTEAALNPLQGQNERLGNEELISALKEYISLLPNIVFPKPDRPKWKIFDLNLHLFLY